MAARLPPEGLSLLAHIGAAQMGTCQPARDRLSGHLLLCRPDQETKEEGSKEIDPELMKTFDKLGIPLHERLALSGVAIDAVMDSVSVKTTFKEKLQEKGIIFSSISEAVRENPELVRKYLGTVVPYRDNYSLRSTVPSSPTVPSFIFRAVFAVRWNSPPISASTRETQDSLSAPSLSATTVVTSLISKAAPPRCATKPASCRHCRDCGEGRRRGEILHCAKLVSW